LWFRIRCVTWVFRGDDGTSVKQLGWVGENADLLVVSFFPYSDPAFGAKTDAMIGSLKKAQ